VRRRSAVERRVVAERRSTVERRIVAERGSAVERRSAATWWFVPGLLALLVTAADLAFARAPLEDGWTVQTVALRDLVEAEAMAEALRDLGFASYTELAMHQGQEWVRVRVGCWIGREGADGIVEILRTLVTDEAVTVPVTGDVPVRCVDIDVGFIKPTHYLPVHLPGEVPTYRIEVAGHVAHVRHDGAGWSVVQGEDEPPPVAAARGAVPYRTGELRGFAVVLVVDEGESTVFCPGRLVAQVADVAVVEWANAIVACSPWSDDDGG
jgi:hypothetical protein